MPMDSMEIIQALAVDDFAILRAWLGNRPNEKIISKKNLGLAYGVLRIWDRAAAYLGALEDMNTKLGQEYLVVSLMESRRYDKAIELIASLEESQSLSFGLTYKVKFLLGCAYKGKGDLDEAIAAFEASGATRLGLFPITVIRLHQLYVEKGDLDGIVAIYETVVAEYPYFWWGWQLLYVASLAVGNIEKAVDVYRRGLAEEHETVKAWATEGLQKVHLNNGENYDLSGMCPVDSMLIANKQIH